MCTSSSSFQFSLSNLFQHTQKFYFASKAVENFGQESSIISLFLHSNELKNFSNLKLAFLLKSFLKGINSNSISLKLIIFQFQYFSSLFYFWDLVTRNNVIPFDIKKRWLQKIEFISNQLFTPLVLQINSKSRKNEKWKKLLSKQQIQWCDVSTENSSKSNNTSVIICILKNTFTQGISSDLTWFQKISSILSRKVYLQAENIFCATLGAAYAAMTRDNVVNKKRHANKAKTFALRQFEIGKQLKDQTLQMKALIYIGYYFIWIQNYGAARKILQTQLERATKQGFEDVRNMVLAALSRLEQESNYFSYQFRNE